MGVKLMALLTIIYITQNCRAKIMRNNALMTKMVSQYREKEPLSVPSQPSKPTNILSIMQNVLCKNFPTIPCDMIMQDETLRSLIEKSIQQVKYKKLTLEKSTPSPPYHLTLFPVLNSEDLSNFLQVSDTGYYKQRKNREPKTKKKQKKSITSNSFWSHEKLPKRYQNVKKESKRTTVYNGRKKLRKFYPHKVKYKDKNNNLRKDFGDYSEEKLSMSVENPEVNNIETKHQHASYKAENTDAAVWRIDYMKHGEPSLNVFGYEADNLKGKIMKTGPNVIVDENALEHVARKDVLHSDVYIKNNFVRKNVEPDSEAID